jgi:hypothetical protein
MGKQPSNCKENIFVKICAFISVLLEIIGCGVVKLYLRIESPACGQEFDKSAMGKLKSWPENRH